MHDCLLFKVIFCVLSFTRKRVKTAIIADDLKGGIILLYSQWHGDGSRDAGLTVRSDTQLRVTQLNSNSFGIQGAPIKTFAFKQW